ncbi:MAG: hypothetical protein JO056_00825 [Alphaproteobacteria bacterium]|nr:hypothetical protein [Alphaproteobacteria bacterium]
MRIAFVIAAAMLSSTTCFAQSAGTLECYNGKGGSHPQFALHAVRPGVAESDPIQFNINRDPENGTIIYVAAGNNGVCRLVHGTNATSMASRFQAGSLSPPDMPSHITVQSTAASEMQVISRDGTMGNVAIIFTVRN